VLALEDKATLSHVNLSVEQAMRSSHVLCFFALFCVDGELVSVTLREGKCWTTITLSCNFRVVKAYFARNTLGLVFACLGAFDTRDALAMLFVSDHTFGTFFALISASLDRALCCDSLNRYLGK